VVHLHYFREKCVVNKKLQAFIATYDSATLAMNSNAEATITTFVIIFTFS